ncbi:MAG: hypothetical protein BHW31_07490 [Firmicutes bacterium CAG:110_56_8]|nr:MAG: hypothetical protein BHW31_07490 [Firmicutes bacterium CAG:110_56_8]
MDNTNESQEFDLDDILREFHEDPDDDVKDTASEEELDVDVLLCAGVTTLLALDMKLVPRHRSSPRPPRLPKPPRKPPTRFPAATPSALTPKRFPKKRRKPLPATTPEPSTI